MSVLADFALSIKQPWAELILLGRKTIEVRTWQTSYRGPLIVHTGQRPAEDFIAVFPHVDSSFRGGFVGIVDLVAIDPFTQSSWSSTRPEHLVPGSMPYGSYGWRLANPRRVVQPQQAKGELGLFSVPEDVQARLLQQLCG